MSSSKKIPRLETTRIKVFLALFNAVPVGAIEVLFDCENQPWFKRAHVGWFLKLENIIMSLKDLDKCKQRTKSNFISTISNTYT